MTLKASMKGSLAGLIASAVSIGSVHGASYEWGFTGGNLNPDLGSGIMAFAGSTAGLTSFGSTDGTTTPHVNGAPATIMSFPQWPTPAANDASLGYTLELTGTPANGGGSYVNQYTIVFDVLFPGSITWTPLFNTAPDNANDADWYVASDGSLGIGALGYSAAGLIQADTWYRLGFTVDLGAGEARYYINGSRVHTRTGSSLLDGRFSLYSNADAGADLLIANENDTSGNYTAPQVYSAIAFVDQTFTDADFLALGGPNSAGILVPEPTALSLVLLGVGSFLAWRRRA